MWDPPNILETQYEFILEIRYKYLYEQHLIVLKTSRDNFLAFLPTTLASCVRVLPIQKIAKKIPKKIQTSTTWRLEFPPEGVLYHVPPAGRKFLVLCCDVFLLQRYSVIANSSCP